MIKVCAVCGREFETNYPHKKICSTECAKVSRNKYQCERQKRLRKKNPRTNNSDVWIPIHSLGCKYEMNQRGQVRNSKTKRILTPHLNKKTYSVTLEVDDAGRRCNRAIQLLLWETHGVLPKSSTRPPVPVTVRRGVGAWYFQTMVAAAKFLSPRVFLSFHRVREKLKFRLPLIEGWQITYHEGD